MATFRLRKTFIKDLQLLKDPVAEVGLGHFPAGNRWGWSDGYGASTLSTEPVANRGDMDSVPGGKLSMRLP